MAISGGDGSIILTTKVDESGLKKGLGSMKKLGATAGKAFLAIGAAAATATVAITKMATSAYADYEQLVGGVETLFKGSAKRVMAYAENAFYTAGISANEYMKQVTSFSAALIRSTAGDTDKAADVANMALQDISDNVNKMGSSMESVQLAYQGFARQQYLLLDNLKLGYGGTKTEMERLLRDAEALTGVKYDINNLADVYSAIHAIQEELGITGTTAKEAEKTITGSANMMKAAWQNVLSAVAGGGDLDRAINNLVYSIQKYFENIVPVVQRSLIGIGQLIERVGPLLVQNVASALIQAIPSLVSAVFNMIVGLAKGIWAGIKALFSGGSGSVTADIKTSVGGVASSVDGISSSLDSATAGMTGLGNATEKAGKKAKRFLAGFDQVTKIPSTDESTAGGGGGVPAISGGIGGADFSTSGLTEFENGISNLVSKLAPEFEKISKMLKKAWDSKPVQAFVKASTALLKTLKLFVTTMWNDIKNNAIKTWKNIESNLKKSGINLVSLWTNVWKGFEKAVTKWGTPIVNAISKLFNSIWATAIDPAVQLIVQAWTDFTQILLDLWLEHGAPLLDNIGEFVYNVIDLFQVIYDSIIEPIITPFLENLTWLWEKHLKQMVKALGDLILSLVNGAMEIYNKFIDPIVKFLLNFLAPAWSTLSSTVIGVVSSIVATLSDLLTGIFKILNGIIDFITGVFTGNWKKAWEGVVGIFEGIWDALSGIVKGVVNIIIDVINGFISGINKINIDIPDWVPGVGGNSIGFNVPKIPKLAQGAVLPPNKPFLAMVGDQKHGTNIEAPLETIKQAVAEVLGVSGGNSENIELTVLLDGDIIYKKVVQKNRDNTIRTGRNALAY